MIFSRDRPAQLDLLLRSLKANGRALPLNVFFPLVVLYRATDEAYAEGYERVWVEHPDVMPMPEVDFANDLVGHCIAPFGEGFVTTFCDDDVLYRHVRDDVITDLLSADYEILCFSLRLGQNTGTCYPLRRLQGLPRLEPRVNGKALGWLWRLGDGDFGYPGSLDGHVWRTADFRELIAGRHFHNPNTLEDALVAGCAGSMCSGMACFPESALVGIPANRVTETHFGNRYGEEHFESERWLNSRFLEGARLDLAAIRADKVSGAHTEFELAWAS